MYILSQTSLTELPLAEQGENINIATVKKKKSQRIHNLSLTPHLSNLIIYSAPLRHKEWRHGKDPDCSGCAPGVCFNPSSTPVPARGCLNIEQHSERQKWFQVSQLWASNNCDGKENGGEPIPTSSFAELLTVRRFLKGTCQKLICFYKQMAWSINL